MRSVHIFDMIQANGVVLCIMRLCIQVGTLHDVLSSMLWTILQNMAKIGLLMIYWYPSWLAWTF